MKKLSLILLLSLATLPLMAQKAGAATDRAAAQSTSVRLEAASDNTVSHTEVLQRSNRVFGEEEGFFWYVYDVNSGIAKIYEEEYFLRIFLGKTYDDALNSLLAISDWFKKAKNEETKRIVTANDESYLLEKSTAYGSACLMLTAGSSDDIAWSVENYKNLSNVVMGAVFSGGGAENFSDVYAEKVEKRKKANKFHPVGMTNKKELQKSIKDFQSRYGK